MYFTQVHEDAILKYAASNCRKEKTELYVKLIQPAFSEMVDKIVFTYKFTTLPNIDELRDDCKIWLTTILGKYDVSKKSKAFSYFSVITKNWFIHKVKQRAKRAKREVDYDDAIKELSFEQIVYYDTHEQEREKEEFWKYFELEMDGWGTNDMNENEKKVYEAIRIILNSVDEIEIFNKKAVYLYLREITGLNTKQIVTQLNKFRKKYKLFKSDWDNVNI
tara:strand:+ start:1705 stop:2364 length:660 start_codon:yes stop_codon:yes gene_type:complete